MYQEYLYPMQLSVFLESLSAACELVLVIPSRFLQ